MPPTTPPTKAVGQTCTSSEIALMLAIMRQIDRPAIDMDALAKAVGAASANAARMRITAAATKHGWFTHAVTAGAIKAGGQKKTKKASAEKFDDEDLETPSKKKNKTHHTVMAVDGTIKTEPAKLLADHQSGHVHEKKSSIEKGVDDNEGI